jgi:Flp pilus assembly protein TadD
MPDHPVVLAALGRKALLENDPRAVDYLSRAMGRGSESLNTHTDLGDALTKAGRIEDAARIYERGVALYPYAPVLSKSLILSYIVLKRYAHAHEAMKRHMELFPEDDFMRGLLLKAESSSSRR